MLNDAVEKVDDTHKRDRNFITEIKTVRENQMKIS